MAPRPSAKRPASETFTSTFKKTRFLDPEEYPTNFSGQVNKLSRRSIQFDLVGVDASIANAIRRILIAEVSTIAIKHVYVWDNTSVIQDEVLAQRIALVPLNVDPSKPEPEPEEIYNHSLVTSGDLTWEPRGEQSEVFASNPLRTTNENIYRLLHLVNTQPRKARPPQHAEKFRKRFSPGVVDVDPVTKAVFVNEKNLPRNETMSREVLRHKEFEGCFGLRRESACHQIY
ncbi:hypothetical protein BJ322DRAFT_1040241 [Thelephora terrestris]|uniref:DNA-directed RNA polymerase RpoA/D/Rpb3-type domain-containing protein n=1 Tax=Thelephora terrestris TaxID=56493 RepID=A0A9P6LBH7_9AGAM|nr:hypothetical protein BJ322DRAFT_1040241 [Thelephora terrestris]